MNLQRSVLFTPELHPAAVGLADCFGQGLRRLAGLKGSVRTLSAPTVATYESRKSRKVLEIWCRTPEETWFQNFAATCVAAARV